MSSSLFHINRMTSTAKGAGLPFLRDKRYQHRFDEETSTEPLGYWQVPQNKLPTFEVWHNYDLLEIYAVSVDGVLDGAPIRLVQDLNKNCYSSPTADKAYYMNDEERTTTLPCGLYYLRLDFDGGPSLYSEVFFVGGVCAINFGLRFEVLTVNMDGSCDVLCTVNHNADASVTSYSSKYPRTGIGTTYTTQTFTITVPLGVTDIRVTLATLYCGAYSSNYLFDNTGGGMITLTPCYIYGC